VRTIIKLQILLITLSLISGCAGYHWSHLDILDGRWSYRKCESLCTQIETQSGQCVKFQEAAPLNCNKWVKSNKKEMKDEDM